MGPNSHEVKEYLPTYLARIDEFLLCGNVPLFYLTTLHFIILKCETRIFCGSFSAARLARILCCGVPPFTPTTPSPLTPLFSAIVVHLPKKKLPDFIRMVS